MGDMQRTPVQQPPAGSERLMVSFDSSGWLYVYHMGVGWWLQRNLATDDGAFAVLLELLQQTRWPLARGGGDLVLQRAKI